MPDPLKGKARQFALAIIQAAPEVLSNKEAALRIGCNEKVASASGSRWAQDERVRALIAEHFPLHPLAKKRAKTLPETAPNGVQAAFVLSAQQICAYIDQLDAHDPECVELVKKIMAKYGTSTDPVLLWDSVLANPLESNENKLKAAKDKAMYTLAKPKSANDKEVKRDKAKARFQSNDLFENAFENSNLPKWTN